MAPSSAAVVICGAGIAGMATAYHLAVRRGMRDVVLVDERPPLTLTSDKSTECYRNWWPGPGDAMVAVMNRSIDLLEELARESGNVFRMNRRGYLFATADPGAACPSSSRRRGGGRPRVRAGPRCTRRRSSDYVPAAADGFDSPADRRRRDHGAGADPPTLPVPRRRTRSRSCTPAAAAGSAASSSACTCSSGRASTVSSSSTGRVEAIDTTGGRVRGVRVSGPGGGRVHRHGPRFVIAAGPFLHRAGAPARRRAAGLLRAAREDRLERRAAARCRATAPLTIWADPVTHCRGRAEERAELGGVGERMTCSLGELPAGAHGRPEGAGDSTSVLGSGPTTRSRRSRRFPLAFDPAYPEVVLRGMARMIPALAPYLERLPRCFVDGGYYTKTRENRLLAGPLPVEGAYVIGALSGYGMMASNGAADLLADHIAERPLPHYAPAFRLDRYDDPAYAKLLDEWGDSGQL